MKKTILILLLFVISLTTYSQNYVSISGSIPNTNNLLVDAYPSIELGRSFENFSISLIVGRNNFDFKDNSQLYFYEGKVSISKQVGVVDLYTLLGVGKYFNDKTFFIEYGFGVSKRVSYYTFSLTYSNWNRINYITPSIGYNF